MRTPSNRVRWGPVMPCAGSTIEVTRMLTVSSCIRLWKSKRARTMPASGSWSNYLRRIPQGLGSHISGGRASVPQSSMLNRSMGRQGKRHSSDFGGICLTHRGSVRHRSQSWKPWMLIGMESLSKPNPSIAKYGKPIHFKALVTPHCSNGLAINKKVSRFSRKVPSVLRPSCALTLGIE